MHSVLSYTYCMIALAPFQINGFTIQFQSNPTSSTFVGNNARLKHSSIQRSIASNHRSMIMYEPSFDLPRRKAFAQRKLNSGFWVALDHTEKWIAETLSSPSTENPHGRKEFTYECELNQYPLGTIAGIFR